MSKNAIVTGITGQDGSYLAEYLCDLGYNVVGLHRRSSTNNFGNLHNVLSLTNFSLVEADLTDYVSLSNAISQAQKIFGGKPDEVYNLAAQSHVATSFVQPHLTFEINAQGVLNLVEALRQHGCIPHTKLHQASTSEMFGNNFTVIDKVPMQDENVLFDPQSPYAVSKVAAHHLIHFYRSAYGLFGCCTIMFNHESVRRHENFVTRKVTKYVAGLHNHMVMSNAPYPKLKLGNLVACRDWGYAGDYVRAAHLALQHDTPDDYVVATGDTYSIKELCDTAFRYIGLNYMDWIEVDEQFVRPAEVPYLCGYAEKARTVLGWKPSMTFTELIYKMIDDDCQLLKKGE